VVYSVSKSLISSIQIPLNHKLSQTGRTRIILPATHDRAYPCVSPVRPLFFRVHPISAILPATHDRASPCVSPVRPLFFRVHPISSLFSIPSLGFTSFLVSEPRLCRFYLPKNHKKPFHPQRSFHKFFEPCT